MSYMKDYLLWCEEKLAADNPGLSWSFIEKICTGQIPGLNISNICGYSTKDYLNDKKWHRGGAWQ